MGFGILFVGYALTFGSLFYSTYFFGDIVGCAVMIVSLLMLAQYCRAFRWAAAGAGGLLAVYVVSAVLRMMGYSTPDEASAALIGERIYRIVQYAVPIFTFLFTVLLLMAAALLAKDVGLDGVARRNCIMIAVFIGYYAIWWLYDLLSERIAYASVRVYNVVGAGLTLMQAAWFIAMLIAILSWLRWIAPAEQVEAEESGDDSANDGVLARLGDRMERLEDIARTKKEDRIGPKGGRGSGRRGSPQDFLSDSVDKDDNADA